MDAKHNADVAVKLSTIPRIRRRAEQWTAAPPLYRLHLPLAGAWLAFLYTLGFFATPTSEEAAPLGLVDSFAVAMLLVTLVGIFAVISLAVQNSRATAPVSIISAFGIMIVGALCGFVGHPISAWGPDVALAGIIVLASAAIMGRGGAQPAA